MHTLPKHWRKRTLASAVFGLLSALTATAIAGGEQRSVTATPIEHVIVIVGENQTFDGLFATYVPRSGASSASVPAAFQT